MFGLHTNANITTAIKDGEAILSTLLVLQPRTSVGGGISREEQVIRQAQAIAARLPANFDVEEAAQKYPVTYDNSMNTVLGQELGRYNKLLDVMRSTLTSLQKALRGEAVLSQELEAMADSLFNGFVPALWSTVAYPSLKPLGSWTDDLLDRLSMFASWLANGPPAVFWLPGFFFTQSFLTGTLQNYARRHKIAIDELTWQFEVMKDMGTVPSHDTTAPSTSAGDSNSDTSDKKDDSGHADDEPTAQPSQTASASPNTLTEPPEDGCYVCGLFLEGARWDADAGILADSQPQELYTRMPVIWMKPTPKDKVDEDASVYVCPLYKTSARAGVLSTTGHSTNFVVAIELPIAADQRESFWVKRGVALLCQKDT